MDSEQSIFWDGLGGVLDTFDFTPGGGGPARVPTLGLADEAETDALAFDNDAFFHSLRFDTAALIFSTDLDPDIYFEMTAGTGGGGGVWATSGLINLAVPPDDVDAIEVWGPDSTTAVSGDDAFNYSLESIPPLGAGATDPGGISVWHVPGSVPGALDPTAFPLLWDFELAAAIAPLAPLPADDLDIIQEQLDLDGMMLDILAFEEGDDVPGSPGGTRTGSINFTIDPITRTDGTTVFDGGEIFVWDFDFSPMALPPVAASFLKHNGHLWDTAFPVMATFLTATENVNGIEAVNTIPEPSSIMLSVIGLLSLAGCGRRRRNT